MSFQPVVLWHSKLVDAGVERGRLTTEQSLGVRMACRAVGDRHAVTRAQQLDLPGDPCIGEVDAIHGCFVGASTDTRLPGRCRVTSRGLPDAPFPYRPVDPRCAHSR